MSDLVAFLRARLDEDEAAAQAAQSWDAEHEKNMPEAEMRECIEFASQRQRNYDQPWWAANMRYQLDRRRLPGDPARVLREVAAKRAILDAAEADMDSPYDLPEGVRDSRDEWERERDGALAGAALETLRHLAAVYADHPDYDEAWRP